MQPQQPVYGPPPSGPSPYDFIVNPNAGSGRSRLPGGNSVVARSILVIGGMIVLLIVFIVGKNLLLVGSTNTPDLISVATQQQELIHLSYNAVQVQTIETTTKNSALTTQLALTSQQQELLVYLKNHGHKVAQKQLSSQGSAATDQQLAAAVAASTYDATFNQIMVTKLTTYKQSLQQASTKGSDAAGQALLQKDYDSAQLLLQQLTPTVQ
jgi:uncharacterized protein YpmB